MREELKTSRSKGRGGTALAHARIARPTLDDYLGVLARAVFQAGLSWAAIDRQWVALLAAFDDFSARKVARYRDADIARILGTPGIVHSERKTRVVVEHARTLIALEREAGSVRAYLRGHTGYRELVADLRQRFPFVGEISAYYFLYRVGETVPPFHRWIRDVQGDHPRIREMVGAAPAKASRPSRRRRRARG